MAWLPVSAPSEFTKGFSCIIRQSFSAPRERVLDLYAAPQAIDVLGGVSALHALPAGVLGPVLPEAGDFQFLAHCGGSPSCEWENGDGAMKPPLRAIENRKMGKGAFADCEDYLGVRPLSCGVL